MLWRTFYQHCFLRYKIHLHQDSSPGFRVCNLGSYNILAETILVLAFGFRAIKLIFTEIQTQDRFFRNCGLILQTPSQNKQLCSWLRFSIVLSVGARENIFAGTRTKTVFEVLASVSVIPCSKQTTSVLATSSIVLSYWATGTGTTLTETGNCQSFHLSEISFWSHSFSC